MQGLAMLETQDDPGDNVLIARVSAGDEDAFRMLATRHSGVIFSVAYRFFRDHATAEDILQETIFRLWSKASEWSPQGGASVRTWLCKIASNLCIDRQRKYVRETIGSISENYIDDSADPESVVASGEVGRQVALALIQLPDSQRLALTLFHYEGLSLQEIALALNVTPKAAEGLLSRGRAAMRQKLCALQH